MFLILYLYIINITLKIIIRHRSDIRSIPIQQEVGEAVDYRARGGPPWNLQGKDPGIYVEQNIMVGAGVDGWPLGIKMNSED